MLWTVPPSLGVGAGLLVKLLIVSGPEWLPLPGRVRLVERIPEPWLTGGRWWPGSRPGWRSA